MAIFTGSVIIDLFSILIALLAVLIAYYKWSFQYWKRKNVPYVEPSIPYGNVQSPLTRTMSIGAKMSEIYKEVKSKGHKYAGMYFFARPAFFVMDLDLVKRVMTKDFNYFTDRGIYTNEKVDPIGAHLFAIGGTKWRNLRAKVSPTFTSGKMKGMFQTLLDCGLVLENYMKQYAEKKEPVDIKKVLGFFSTDIIGSCAFGLECNSFKEPNSAFRRYSNKIFERTKLEELKSLIPQTFPKIGNLFGMRQIPKDVGDFFIKVVRDTVNYRKENSIVRNDFLQLLIDLKNNKEGQENGEKGDDAQSLTIEQIAAQSFVFFLAGFETSSTTMSFALYELATYPDLQAKVRDEINKVFEKHENQLTYDMLSELKFMDQVIDETLRKYPPLPFLMRECNEDYKVPDSSVIIEKGTRVIIPVIGIHYDEDYYENPNVFDPERFNDQNKLSRHQYTHLAFGEGPRICIGARFGVMQSKVGLSKLLRNFKVTVNEKTKVPLEMASGCLIPTVRDGIWLNFEKI